MHYIRLVVLGDSQVGKTSLIRQLVGQEHKFEPELKVAAKLETERATLDAGWLSVLCKHEQQLERGIETKRLASLLASQIELQQLLLQQQRSCTSATNDAKSTTAGRRLIDRKQQQPRKSLPIEGVNVATANKAANPTGASKEAGGGDFAAEVKKQAGCSRSLPSAEESAASGHQKRPVTANCSMGPREATNLTNIAAAASAIAPDATTPIQPTILISVEPSGPSSSCSREPTVLAGTCSGSNPVAAAKATTATAGAGKTPDTNGRVKNCHQSEGDEMMVETCDFDHCETGLTRDPQAIEVGLSGNPISGPTGQRPSPADSTTATSSTSGRRELGPNCRPGNHEHKSKGAPQSSATFGDGQGGFEGPHQVQAASDCQQPRAGGGGSSTVEGDCDSDNLNSANTERIRSPTSTTSTVSNISTLQNANHVPEQQQQQRQLLLPSQSGPNKRSPGEVGGGGGCQGDLGGAPEVATTATTLSSQGGVNINLAGCDRNGGRSDLLPQITAGNEQNDPHSANTIKDYATQIPIKSDNKQPQAAGLQAGALKQKSLEVGTTTTSNNTLDGANLEPLQPGQGSHRALHRHSYCAPSQPQPQVCPPGRVQQQAANGAKANTLGGARQQTELSTQAKIINILFTRNEPKEGSSGGSAGATQTSGQTAAASQQQQLAADQSCQASGSAMIEEQQQQQKLSQQPQQTKNSRPMLMPSLLRQYQRRLSNFHQASSNTGSGADQRDHHHHHHGHQSSMGQDELRRLANEEEEERRNQALSAADELRRRERVRAAAQAAATLAKVAASAAQALLVQQKPVGSSRLEPADGHASSLLLDMSNSHLDITGTNQINLYSLTAEYQRRLATSMEKQQPNGGDGSFGDPAQAPLHQQQQNSTAQRKFNASSQSRHQTYKQQIRHFNVNYINDRSLYEINIVDMPTIEPKAFPTNSLFEWSLYKGESHLLNADAYLLVFDLTRPNTIQYIKMLRDKIFESREMSHVPVYVIANKADLCPTLQPSLQARRLRNVAVHRNQANAANPTPAGQPGIAGSGAAKPLAGATSAKSAATAIAGKKALPPVGPPHAQVWAPPTADLTGAPRSVPAAAARQLLAAYKVHRMRLGGSGPIVSLRRWAKLRRAIVANDNEPGVAGPGPAGASSGQWLQFERNRMHYNLIIGASGGDSLGNQWGSSLGRAFRRFKSCVNRGLKRLSLHRKRVNLQVQDRNSRGARNRRRSMAASGPSVHRPKSGSRASGVAQWGSRAKGGGGSGSCGQMRQRRRRGRRRRHSCGQAIRTAASAAIQEASASTSGGFNGALARWFPGRARNRDPGSPTLVASTTNDSPGVAAATQAKLWSSYQAKLKRKRGDQSDSGGSKSESLRSRSGSRRKQRADNNFRHYSKLLTMTAKPTAAQSAQAGGQALEPVGSSGNNKPAETNVIPPLGGQDSSQSAPRHLVEPICGSMSTVASRQNFYDLFNRLLQTSSTTAAKTQLKLSSNERGHDNNNNNNNNNNVAPDSTGQPSQLSAGAPESKGPLADGCSPAGQIVPATQSIVPAPLLQVNPATNERRNSTTPSKKEGRRKSSSTGAALWQTLSNYALSRTSRGSVCGQQDTSGANQQQQRRESSSLQQPSSGPDQQSGSRRSTQTQLQPGAANTTAGSDGLHLGAEQYLSVDMLRKLSLVSAHSQMSVPIAEADGAEEMADCQDEPARAKSSLTILGSRESPEPAANTLVSLAKRVSKENLRLRQQNAPGSEPTAEQLASNRPSTATPSGGASRTKRIWYRGMVKRILFQTNKPSLRNIVTALELQKKAEALSSSSSSDSSGSSDGAKGEGDNGPEVQQAAPSGDNKASHGSQAERGPGEQAAAAASSTGNQLPQIDRCEPDIGTNAQQQSDKLANGRKSVKQSLSVVQSAPSIRIITSGSSMSLLSENNNSGERSTDSENFDSQARRDRNHNEQLPGKQQQQPTQVSSLKSLPNDDKPNCEQQQQQQDDGFLTKSRQTNGQEQTNGTGSGQNRTCASSSAAAGDADQVAMSISPSASASLSSLSESVSLTLDPGSRQYGCQPRGKANEEARATSANLEPEADASCIPTPEDRSVNLPVVGADISKKLLTFQEVSAAALQQPQLMNSMRKLSADDCLFINRQRRQSLTAVTGTTGKLGKNAAAADDDSWLLVGRDQTQSACGAFRGPSDEPMQLAGSGPQGDDVDGPNSDSRRQSIKASIENAIHLLVPRAKGTRSASITLGASDCEQRSRSQLGSIMGAVNVHKTWRDWRQLLGKKKSNTGADSGVANKDTNGQSNSNKSQPGSGLADNSAASPILGFLSSHSAFTKLSSEQQRETAINFDQLMRINQLTLSAANVVMLANGGPNESHGFHHHHHQGDKQQALHVQARDSSASKLGSLMFEQAAVCSSDNICGLSGTLEGSVLLADAASRRQANKRAAVAAGGAGRQHKPLITRLQSGGNLLLNRSSIHRRLKATAELSTPLETQFGCGAPITSASSSSSGRLASSGDRIPGRVGEKFRGDYASDSAIASETSLLFADKCNTSTSHHRARGHQVADKCAASGCLHSAGLANSTLEDSWASATGGPSALASATGLNPAEGGEMSAQIAAAAAAALERQKRRCEELSLIIEPRFDKKQPGAQYPLFVSHDLNPILKDLAQLVRKHWKCNYVECSAASNWNIKPIISELTRTLEYNHLLREGRGPQDETSDESGLSSYDTDDEDLEDDEDDFDNDDDDDELESESESEDGDEAATEAELANGSSGIGDGENEQWPAEANETRRTLDPTGLDELASEDHGNRSRHTSDSSIVSSSNVLANRHSKLAAKLRPRRADSLGGGAILGSESRGFASRLFESGRRTATDFRRPSAAAASANTAPGPRGLAAVKPEAAPSSDKQKQRPPLRQQVRSADDVGGDAGAVCKPAPTADWSAGRDRRQDVPITSIRGRPAVVASQAGLTSPVPIMPATGANKVVSKRQLAARSKRREQQANGLKPSCSII